MLLGSVFALSAGPRPSATKNWAGPASFPFGPASFSSFSCLKIFKDEFWAGKFWNLNAKTVGYSSSALLTLTQLLAQKGALESKNFKGAIWNFIQNLIVTAKYTFYRLLKMWIVIMVMITSRDRVILVWLGQCPGCWCPGSFHCQDISSHDIDYKYGIGRSLSYLSMLRKDYNYLCHIIVEKVFDFISSSIANATKNSSGL